EDHVPMAPLAAQRAARLVEDAMTVVAIEALLAAQAVDLRGLTPAPALRPLYDAVRQGVPMMVEDRVLGEDIATVRNAIASRVGR
ncbi:MAG: aromatic amino acid lyase, partial [Pseudomonadota bacterium]